MFVWVDLAFLVVPDVAVFYKNRPVKLIKVFNVTK